MKKTIFFIACIMSSLAVNAQSFSELKKANGENPFTEDWFKLYVRFTAMTPTYTPSFSGYTVNLALRNDKFKKWEGRSRYENPTLGDFLFMLTVDSKEYIQTGGIKSKAYDDHAHGGGFLGWYQYYVNAVAQDKLLISPGISMGDYIIGSRYSTATTPRQDQNPYGYYFAAGPAVMASYVITPQIWIDGYVNYDISFYKVKNKIKTPYPNPHFLTVGADLNTTKKLFGGFRLNKTLDKGANKDASSRIDISAGITF